MPAHFGRGKRRRSLGRAGRAGVCSVIRMPVRWRRRSGSPARRHRRETRHGDVKTDGADRRVIAHAEPGADEQLVEIGCRVL